MRRLMVAIGLALLVSVAVVYAAKFVEDSFTDADTTVLSSHTGETGATWTLSASTPSSWVITDANRARTTTTSRSNYFASGTPASAEYDVTATVYFFTIIANQYCGVNGRGNGAADDGYEALYSQADGAWLLGKRVGGAFSSLGTWTNTPATTTNITLKLQIRDAAKKLFVDGVERISSADNAVTATGSAGVLAIGAASTNSTGCHLADFCAGAAGDCDGGGGAAVVPKLTLLGVGGW